MTVKYQISDKRGDAILLVSTEGPAEHADLVHGAFAAAVQKAGLDSAYQSFDELPGAIKTVTAVFPGAQVTAAAGPPDPWGTPPVPPFQPEAPPAPPVPAAAAPQRGGGQVKNGFCNHGAATPRASKEGAPKQWRGYFCPAPKGAPDQCEPEFVR